MLRSVIIDLVDLMLPAGECEDLRRRTSGMPSVQVSDRIACDLELLATGGFSPLDRFMSHADYARVLGEMRLASGHLFPIPVMLPVAADAPVALDREVAIRDSRNDLLAVMRVEDIYAWDPAEYSALVLGTRDTAHPLVPELETWGPRILSGSLRVLQLPRRPDFADLRLTPAETRRRLAAAGHARVVAFHPRQHIHRAEEEMTRRAADAIGGTLLVHPAVGMTTAGDVNHFTRVRAYRALVDRHDALPHAVLALLPLAMRLAGPREAVWQALVRRNHGATHVIVNRDHAGAGTDSAGRPFYAPYAAAELVARHAQELGVTMVPYQDLVYVPDEERYVEVSQVPEGARTWALSAAEVKHDYLDRGRLLPSWFTRPAVAEILAETYPPRHRQGVCVWLTGLSGAGKSTIAQGLTVRLLEHGREVTLLDGDVVRTLLSKGLGFGKSDRDLNVQRIGFVASEIVRHGGAVVCAAISPYRATRDAVRSMMPAGQFVEVFVDTPLAVCEQRDTKGLYARARRGEVAGVTGIDDPYETPLRAEITLRAGEETAADQTTRILGYLASQGFVRVDPQP